MSSTETRALGGSTTTVSSVIERLPFSRAHGIIVLIAALGYMFDSFDTYIVGFAMPSISTEWQLSPVFSGALASAGMWGMFIGAMAWGPIIDRIGRKQGFVMTILGFSLVSGVTALSTGTTQFLAFRFISGLFLGGMLPVVSTLVSEYAGASFRGKFVAVPPVFWPVGLFAAATCAFLFVEPFGWRSLFIAGVLPALLAVAVIRTLPESPRWLVSKGRTKEAGEVLVRLGARPEEVTNLVAEEKRQSASVLVLLKRPYLSRFILTTSVLFFGFFSYYGFTLWLPSFMMQEFGLSSARTFMYTVFVGGSAILGKLYAFFTIDRFGRKQLFYVGFGVAGFASLAFGQLTNPTHMLIGACVLLFLFEMAAAGCVVLPTELFPSHVRGTANSWTSASGKLAAAISPLVFGIFMKNEMYYGIFITMAIFCWIVCLMIFTIGVETKGRTLEQVGAS